MDKGSVPAILALLGFLMAAPANAGQAQEPGDTFRDCVACPEMVVLPAGAFVMGTDGRHEYERPAHRVTLGRPFAMGKFELTFEEWGACFDDGGRARVPDDHNWGGGRRPAPHIPCHHPQPCRQTNTATPAPSCRTTPIQGRFIKRQEA